MFLSANFNCISSNQLGNLASFLASKKNTCLLKPFVCCVHKNTFQDYLSSEDCIDVVPQWYVNTV